VILLYTTAWCKRVNCFKSNYRKFSPIVFKADSIILSMNFVTRHLLLTTLSKHEALTIDDIAKPEYLGLLPDLNQLKYLLHQLSIRGHIAKMNGTTPTTYMITKEGIEENNRLMNHH
jgi:hypothetical protein